MYIPQNYFVASILMFITMLCWGSWANANKFDRRWRFELFYWDYALGVLLTSFLFAFTLGSFGQTGLAFFPDAGNADLPHQLNALLGGVVFNIANILLVAAIAIAGMAVAFPVGIGIALVIGTVLSYAVNPAGKVGFLFLGVLFVLAAIILDAVAYKKIASKEVTKKGILLSVISGVLMGLFYPLVAHSMQGQHALGPYSAVVFFASGLFLSNFAVNSILMKKTISGPALSLKDYMNGTIKQHAIGWLGGFIWCVGMSLNIIASVQAGSAVAYAFGQGATLIAALWGVFIWKEFRGARGVYSLLAWMFFCYILGLLFIGIASAPY